MTNDLPLPGDTCDNRTVIASVYINDGDEPGTGMVLLLNPTKPYYSIVDVELGSNTPAHDTEARFENVNDAVAHFADNGGDA